MFGIKVTTPVVTNADGWSHAGGELKVGDESLKFLVDLTWWRVADYEHQWRDAMDRLAHGTRATALVTAYAGPGGPHRMWALWRDDDFVYVQEHIVVPTDLDTPFDPSHPDAHVGARISPEHGAPIAEWRIELLHVLAAAFGIRWPLYPR